MPLGAFKLNLIKPLLQQLVSGYILEFSSATYPEATSLTRTHVDSDGNIILLFSLDQNFSNNRIAVLKISPNADIIWQRVLASTQSDVPTDMVVLSNGNIAVCFRQGVSNSAGFTVINGTNGSTVFTRTFSVSSDNFTVIMALTKDSSDNIYFIGRGNNQRFFYFYKYSSTGTLINGPLRYNPPPGLGVAPTVGNGFLSSNGNTLFTVVRGNRNQNSNDDMPFLFTLNSNATITFRASYGSGQSLFPNSIAQDQSNNVYIKHDNRFIIKFNSSGQVQWQKSYGTSTIGGFSSALTTDSENLYCSSHTSSGLLIFCISAANGEVVWQQQLSRASTTFETFNHQLFVDNNLVYVSAHNSTNNSRLLAAFPKNGTGLGSYGSYTLSGISLASAVNTSYSTMSNSFVTNNTGISVSTPTIVNNAAAYTLTKIEQ